MAAHKDPVREVKLDRNNTDFPIMLFEALKQQNIGGDPRYAFLKYWQDLCRVYITKIDVGARGLLVQHQMGFGKSILAIALAFELMTEGRVLMILAKSLHNNMRDQIKKYVELRGKSDDEFAPGKMNGVDLDAWITQKFNFVSLDAGNMIEQVAKHVESQDTLDKILDAHIGRIVGDKGPPNLNGVNIVVDEAHRLFRMIANGSKNGLTFYDAVRLSTCKIFFLTGTPVASDAFEVVPCFNMLGSHPGANSAPLFPELYEEFNRLFVDPTTKQLINRDKYQNRIMGLVTSISIHDDIGVDANPSFVEAIAKLRKMYPVEYPLVVRKVHMSGPQWAVYQLAREREMEETKRRSGDVGSRHVGEGQRAPSARMTKAKSHAASTYKVKSRQYSNFCAVNQLTERDPQKLTNVVSTKFDAMYADIIARPGQLGAVYSQFIGVGGLGAFAKYLENKGWVAENKVSYNEEESEVDPTPPQVEGGWHTELDQQQDTNYTFELPVVYGASEPDELYPDLSDYMTALGDASWTMYPPPTYGGHEKDTSLKFAVLTGSVPIDERARIVRMYTSDDNLHGEQCMLLLMSATGAEGLDLKALRYALMMEPYWVWNRYAQFFARGPRIGSHDKLPEAERNFQPLLYLSIPPESEKSIVDNNEVYALTTDTELYQEALINKESVASFVGANKEVSIECMMNGGQCRICAPCNAVLFTDDPDADIRRPDPCIKYQPANIQAQPIEYQGKRYFYVHSDGPLGYDVFVFDVKLGAHVAVPPNSELFESIVRQIDPSLFDDIITEDK